MELVPSRSSKACRRSGSASSLAYEGARSGSTDVFTQAVVVLRRSPAAVVSSQALEVPAARETMIPGRGSPPFSTGSRTCVRRKQKHIDDGQDPGHRRGNPRHGRKPKTQTRKPDWWTRWMVEKKVKQSTSSQCSSDQKPLTSGRLDLRGRQRRSYRKAMSCHTAQESLFSGGVRESRGYREVT